jgi:NAD(P)-dependent dehydrogenase (short-subunit alcohol dehydrogenase family)
MTSGAQTSEFDGAVVIVTGASSGIGKATARAFWERGASLVINSRVASKIGRAAQEIDPTGHRVEYVVGDVSKRETTLAIAARAIERFGRIDVLVNNAGTFKRTSFLEHTQEAFDTTVGVILKGTFFMTQAVIPIMRENRRGVIVNLGSIWGIQAIGRDPSAAHSAAKAAVHALTRSLAFEFAIDNIRVNAIAPAYVDKIPPSTTNPDDFHPLMRRGQPGDIVEAILFLASERAAWVTGVVLPVDGGVTSGKH